MEIEVGEWIRDKDGLILKYEYLNEYDNFEVAFGQKGKCITFDDMEEFEDYVKNNIVSHNKNIIDLIQEGDRLKIIADGQQLTFELDELDYKHKLKNIGNEIQIKSIITREQMESVEYLF